MLRTSQYDYSKGEGREEESEGELIARLSPRQAMHMSPRVNLSPDAVVPETGKQRRKLRLRNLDMKEIAGRKEHLKSIYIIPNVRRRDYHKKRVQAYQKPNFSAIIAREQG